MRVYFYHTQDMAMMLRKFAAGELPPHFLYGATKLADYGIDVVWHPAKAEPSRWKMMVRNTWKILLCREKYDVLYATHYRGLEVIVFLRALRLFRKPIAVWHHQPIITSSSCLRELVGRLFYKGFDHMFFFSAKLFDDSLTSKKAHRERMSVAHWGMDIPSWSASDDKGTVPPHYISTGKEMRDVETLVKAFNATGAPIDIYTNRRNGDMNYSAILQGLDVRENIKIHFVGQFSPYEISREVERAGCVCICCLPTKYTAGLTTLVEALALGKPIICSRNPQFPFSVDDESCGISVDYYDTDGWIAAINYINDNPDTARAMGLRARELARTRYNDRICASEVAAVLHECVAGSGC